MNVAVVLAEDGHGDGTAAPRSHASALQALASNLSKPRLMTESYVSSGMILRRSNRAFVDFRTLTTSVDSSGFIGIMMRIAASLESISMDIGGGGYLGYTIILSASFPVELCPTPVSEIRSASRTRVRPTRLCDASRRTRPIPPTRWRSDPIGSESSYRRKSLRTRSVLGNRPTHPTQ